MLSYRVILDVPLPLVAFVSGLLAAHRREIGTRTGTRALTCWKQAVFTLAWFRDRPEIRRPGRGCSWLRRSVSLCPHGRLTHTRSVPVLTRHLLDGGPHPLPIV